MSSSLSSFTTFGIGGKAKRLTIAKSRTALIDGIGRGGLVLGYGSNVLASDSGYGGEVIINRYDSVKVAGCTVVAASGSNMTRVARVAAENGLSGLEFACGIPGSVGGGVRMNAGAFGLSIGDVIEYADVLRDGKVVRLCKDSLGLSYRSSGLQRSDVVISAAFALSGKDRSAIEARMRDYMNYRAATQPKGKSAGSIFKNPAGVSVGRIIERAGLKGYRDGGAVISKEHGNIIINTGNATAREVVRVIYKMKEALNAFGCMAEEEIVYIGDF
ncbi:MAG: UDP-N-acetylmuramate dehydrogenase [Clostridiales bacterium]|nr:UDP-N-acetylmuramate dehydrogenase [Clostridiales bacterium]